jgi:hypothetical protein
VKYGVATAAGVHFAESEDVAAKPVFSNSIT